MVDKTCLIWHLIVFPLIGDSLRCKRIDEALLKMLVLDMQPASIVEDKGFQDFLKVMDSKYMSLNNHEESAARHV